MKKEMRRKEKAISADEIKDVLDNAEYGILSTISEDGTPYGTPLNFAYSDGAIYFHCACEGHKLENIRYNENVCFNVFDSVLLMPEDFNTQYRSVTVFGKIFVVQNDDEKNAGISAIARKLSPDFIEAGKAYIERAFNDMHVLKLEPEYMTGKATRG